MLRSSFVLLTICVTACPHLAAEPGWFLKEMPDVPTVKEEPATPEETKQIRELIRELAKIDKPDIGYSSTMAGHAFPPVADSDHWSGWTMSPLNGQLKRADALKELVEYGPKALPFLLGALTDKTPTKLVLPSADRERNAPIIVPSGLFSPRLILPFLTLLQAPLSPWLTTGREIPGNPINCAERRILKAAHIHPLATSGIAIDSGDGKGVPTAHIAREFYRLKVGDIAFVAIGMITNRHYLAARYTATDGVTINSAAHDARIAETVRTLWAGKGYRQHLLESLWIDFHTRGGDDRGAADSFQTGAAMRLLYYFPKVAGPLVAKRLRELDLSVAERTEAGLPLHEANGASPEDFLKAVVFSEDRSVRQTLLSVFRRTVSPQLAVIVAPVLAKRDHDEILAKLTLFLRALPVAEKDSQGIGYELLVTVIKCKGNTGMFIEYLKNGTDQRRVTVCRVLAKHGNKLYVSWVLPPLLRDKREVRKDIYEWPADAEPELPLRICDLAALAIAKHRKDLFFDLKKDRAHRDRQIAALRKKLTEEP